jgi:hypothetical protein
MKTMSLRLFPEPPARSVGLVKYHYACTLPDGTVARATSMAADVTHAVIVQGIESQIWFVREWTALPDYARIYWPTQFVRGVRVEVIEARLLGSYEVR